MTRNKSIFRKRTEDAFYAPDPTSQSAWSACLDAARATSLAVRAVSRLHHARGAELAARLLRLTGSSSASLYPEARSPVPADWSYPDFARLGEIGAGMVAMHREIIDSSVGPAYAENTASALVALHDAMGPYAKLVKRERAFERLSGEASERTR